MAQQSRKASRKTGSARKRRVVVMPAPKKARAKSPAPMIKFSFEFLGFRDGWYALRADMTPKPTHERLDGLSFENEVLEWLISNRITPGTYAHMGNGNLFPDRPQLPSVKDGSVLGLLLKRPADVVRFEMRFPCKGINPDTMMAALRLEAGMIRFGASDIAKVVYDAYRRLTIIYGNESPTWEDADEIDRESFIAGVEHHIAHLEDTPKQSHEAWVRNRLAIGWSFGPKNNRAKTHPSLVPWDQLSLLERTKNTLFSDMVSAMVPLVED